MTKSAELVKTLINSSPVFIASKSWCGFCKRAISNVEGQGVKPQILELDTRDDGNSLQNELQSITKQTTVPYIFVKGKFIGGYSDFVKTNYSTNLKQELHK